MRPDSLLDTLQIACLLTAQPVTSMILAKLNVTTIKDNKNYIKHAIKLLTNAQT